ncbi:ubiquitin-related domain-containing protein [Gigaspora rosea]|uniref:Ubiquitin-related domain-containing protein n=1 Tax=Gigaspora rosea TaxID=44941 RepID=A0A397UE29_9GLOM|nr:ubiquitin-related domain-containing protein [Gigaspora rosea]
MNLVDETSFATEFLSNLSTRPVKYPQDFAPPAQTRPRPPVRTTLSPSNRNKSTGKQKPQETPEEFETSQGVGIPIHVHVKSLKGGQTHTVQLSNSETVLNLKERLWPLVLISPVNQRLIFKGKALVDNKTLFEYGISDATTIHLVQKSGTGNSGPTITSEPTTSSQEVPQNIKEHKVHQLSPEAIEKLKDPQFLLSLRSFLRSQFSDSDDADHVLKDFINIYQELNGKITIEDLEKLVKD